MTVPYPGAAPLPPMRSRPDETVGRSSGFDMGGAFDKLDASMRALQETMAGVGRDVTGALDQAGRFGAPGAGATGASNAASRAARIKPTNLLQSIAKDQRFGLHDPTAGQTSTSSLQATTSLESAAAFAAQYLGERIAGTSLYQSQSPPAGATTTATLAGAGGRGSGGAPPGSGPPGGGSGGGGGVMPGGGAGPGGGGGGGASLRQTLGARLAASGGSSQGITRALHDIPGIGLGMDLAGHLEDQREKNRAFQEVEGGSNAAGFLERGHQAAYQLSMLGVMSPQNAALAFQGVTDIGFSRANKGPQGGQNRQSALNFAYHNYMSTGMPIQQSLDLLETASENTAVSFQKLEGVLKSVSDTAGQAGVSAESARQSFAGMLAQALGSGAGAGAGNLAGGLATMQASYGRAFDKTSFGNETSQAMQYMLSGKYGLTPGATQYLMQTQPGTYSKMLAGNNNQIISGLLTSSMTNQIQGLVKSYGGASSLDPAKTQQIANQFFGANYNSLNPAVMAQVINQQTGLNLTANNVIPWIVNQTAGKNEASSAPGDPRGQSVSARNTASAPHGKEGLAVASRPSSGGGRAGWTGGNQPGYNWQGVLQQDQGGPGHDAAATSYLSAEQKSGQRNPVLESLLQSVSPGSMVSVSTRSGQRVMSLADAMKYYPNELASGGGNFRSGSKAGQSVSQITGGLTDSAVSDASELQQRAGSNLGQTVGAYNRAHPAAQGPGGRAVTVTLSSEARQLLKLLPSNSNPAAASGTVPVNPYAGTASR